MRYLVIFTVSLVIGGAVMLIARTARHQPFTTPSPAVTVPPVSAPISNDKTTVNTRCPVCGMDVDGNIAAQQWQGHAIGLGCAKCPEKFSAHPDHYGPYALKNLQAPKP